MALDEVVAGYAAGLRDCLTAALGVRPVPPADICVIPGEDGRTFLSVGLNQDRCCEGFAWVRVANLVPKYPAGVETEPGNCGVFVWQLDLEMGVARCWPFGDLTAGPSCEVMQASAAQVLSDMGGMIEASCCFRPTVESGRSVATNWAPFGPDGGCTGGIMGISIEVDDCGCDN